MTDFRVDSPRNKGLLELEKPRVIGNFNNIRPDAFDHSFAAWYFEYIFSHELHTYFERSEIRDLKESLKTMMCGDGASVHINVLSMCGYDATFGEIVNGVFYKKLLDMTNISGAQILSKSLDKRLLWFDERFATRDQILGDGTTMVERMVELRDLIAYQHDVQHVIEEYYHRGLDGKDVVLFTEEFDVLVDIVLQDIIRLDTSGAGTINLQIILTYIFLHNSELLHHVYNTKIASSDHVVKIESLFSIPDEDLFRMLYEISHIVYEYIIKYQFSLHIKDGKTQEGVPQESRETASITDSFCLQETMRVNELSSRLRTESEITTLFNTEYAHNAPKVVIAPDGSIYFADAIEKHKGVPAIIILKKNPETNYYYVDETFYYRFKNGSYNYDEGVKFLNEMDFDGVASVVISIDHHNSHVYETQSAASETLDILPGALNALIGRGYLTSLNQLEQGHQYDEITCLIEPSRFCDDDVGFSLLLTQSILNKTLLPESLGLSADLFESAQFKLLRSIQSETDINMGCPSPESESLFDPQRIGILQAYGEHPDLVDFIEHRLFKSHIDFSSWPERRKIQMYNSVALMVVKIVVFSIYYGRITGDVVFDRIDTVEQATLQAQQEVIRFCQCEDFNSWLDDLIYRLKQNNQCTSLSEYLSAKLRGYLHGIEIKPYETPNIRLLCYNAQLSGEEVRMFQTLKQVAFFGNMGNSDSRILLRPDIKYIGPYLINPILSTSISFNCNLGSTLRSAQERVDIDEFLSNCGAMISKQVAQRLISLISSGDMKPVLQPELSFRGGNRDYREETIIIEDEIKWLYNLSFKKAIKYLCMLKDKSDSATVSAVPRSEENSANIVFNEMLTHYLNSSNQNDLMKLSAYLSIISNLILKDILKKGESRHLLRNTWSRISSMGIGIDLHN
jgi:hypothetical protein